jgi:hypothetical protein
LKGADESLDNAIADDDEPALVMSSDPLLTVAAIFAETRTDPVDLQYRWSEVN